MEKLCLQKIKTDKLTGWFLYTPRPRHFYFQGYKNTPF